MFRDHFGFKTGSKWDKIGLKSEFRLFQWIHKFSEHFTQNAAKS